MTTATVLSLLLALAAALAVQIGCGTAPATQIEKDVGTESPQSTALLPKSSQTDPAQPTVSGLDTDEPQQKVVEVGYKKGMHVPEIGMILLDGTRVTSAKLVEEGKPTFVYFHATW